MTLADRLSAWVKRNEPRNGGDFLLRCGYLDPRVTIAVSEDVILVAFSDGSQYFELTAIPAPDDMRLH